jgi:hypothetical protein
LDVFKKEVLDAVAWQLNTRPRKSWGWIRPAKVFTTEAFDFKQHKPHSLHMIIETALKII